MQTTNRLPHSDPARAAGITKPLFDGARAKLGIAPNILRVFGDSLAALEGYRSFGGALAGGVLNAKVSEQIVLAVAEINDCHDRRGAHRFIEGKIGLNDRQLADARLATSSDPRTSALLKRARSFVVQRGELSDAEFEAVRSSDLTDAEIVETIANVALNILTNYLNHVARRVVDFPEVKPTAPSTEA